MTEFERILLVAEESGNRLDLYLVEHFQDQSRSRIQSWIKEGNVTVNGEKVTKTGYKIEKEDAIQVLIPPSKDVGLVPENIPLDVIFENDDLIAINKPAGMVVHPSAGHQTGTLVHAVLAHAPDLPGIGGEHRPGVVHRLDKDTSGVILFAKNDLAMRWLQQQFKTRKVEKYYLALVDGHPPTSKGRVEAPIGRDPSHRQKMAVVPANKGKMAISEYEVVEKFRSHSLVRVKILTGRTHQIRLHLDFLDCPVVGDRVYGRRHPSQPIKRQFLHAAALHICLPGESTPQQFSAPLPGELTDLLNQLR